MGVASPLWMRAIDHYGTLTADKPMHFNRAPFGHIESETYGSTVSSSTAVAVREVR